MHFDFSLASRCADTPTHALFLHPRRARGLQAYKDPAADSLREADARGCVTAYAPAFATECFAGALRVTLLGAAGLPSGLSLTGAPDPYCVLSLSGGSSAWTSGVRRFTRNPVWSSSGDADDDDASCATTLLVRRQHPPAAEVALRVRVMDSRALHDDDTLGEAEAPLARLMSTGAGGARRVVELPLSCGGVVRLAARFRTMEEEQQTREAAAQERANQADGNGISAGGVVPPAVIRSWATSDAPLLTPASLMAAAAAVLAPGAATESAAAAAAGVTDTTAEASWGAPDADSGWTQLADASAASYASALPAAAAAVTAASDFDKLCFIFEPRTDTQVALWRAAATQPHSRRRALVVAFRGTETSSVTDILTDVRLAMRPFTPGADDTEAARSRSGNDADGSAATMAEAAAADTPQVHDGFLDAFTAVRARVLAALDDAARDNDDDAQARDDDNDDVDLDDGATSSCAGWHVMVTGHSLGGALATLFAADLAASVRSGSSSVRARVAHISMVNFGSPRVGNDAFCDAYGALVRDSVRVVNGSDAVPTLPALLGYRHVSAGVRVTADGIVAAEAPPALLAPPAAAAGAGVQALRGAMVAGAAQLAAAALGGGDDGEDDGSTSGRNDVVAAEVAAALAALVDAAAFEAHFEAQYLCALRAARERRCEDTTPSLQSMKCDDP
jgi:hypothetical protein